MEPILKWDILSLGFPGGSMVKNLPVMQETCVQSLEKEMATHFSFLALEPGRL